MVKKMKSDGTSVSSLQITPTPPPATVEQDQPVKKKEMTPAKKEAMNKMFEGLKAKREADKLEQEKQSAPTPVPEPPQPPPPPPPPAEIKKPKAERAKKVVNSYVTIDDLEYFKREMMGVLPKTIYKEVPVPFETVREKIVQAPPKKISGNELLDSIFFR